MRLGTLRPAKIGDWLMTLQHCEPSIGVRSGGNPGTVPERDLRHVFVRRGL